MALRIANNIPAMTTQRWLAISDAGLKKSLERLSSGYRINRAADDAAGLAISQGFRADIASFKVASRNTSEASALLQVAEGAMDQIGNMMTRLKELATQAASANAGANTAQIDAEKEKLIAEIQRIASVTEYAGTKLIDGTFGDVSGAMQGGTATSTNSYGVNSDYSQKFVFTDVQNETRTTALGLTSSGQTISYLSDGGNNYYKYTDTGNDEETITLSVSNPQLVDGTTYTLTAGAGATVLLVSDGVTREVGSVSGNTLAFSAFGITLAAGGALNTSELGGDTLEFVDTGMTAYSADASATATGAYTVSTSGSGTVTLTGNVTDSAVVSNNQLVFSTMGLTIDLDGDYAAGDLDDLTFTLTQTGTDTDTTTITFSISKTGIDTSAAYNLNQVSGNNYELGNGTVTDTGTITGSTLAFTNLGITLLGASSFTAVNLDNDSIAVSNTGISALSVTSSATTGTYTVDDTAGSITVTHSGGSTQTESGSAGNVVNFDQLGIKITLDSDYTAGVLDDLGISVTSTGASTFQVGTADNVNDRISITLDNVTTGSSGLNIADISLLNAATAQTALTTIDTAIQSLSTARGNIGAYMNRLGYAAANLATTIENVQAAESVIRDLDMAEEMTQFTKNQILLQAGTAMLAQANMAPQQVLALFG